MLATGDGDGTFTPGAEIAGTAGAQGLDAGDINGDGKPDIVTAGPGGLSYLRNTTP